ncbi:MAG: TRAP transporter substrate-binding protein DctP [Acidobacteriota bacterium]
MVFFLGLTASASARTVVKMATLVPEGSVWDTVLRDMGAEWQESTGGDVRLRLYPGGVAGDEPDIVRKMRVGQLHAAALSITGLTAIDSGFDVFTIPMFFESYDELHHVLDTLRPDFEKRLDAKGYVLLSWGNGGWIHLFSKGPIVEVDDLRAQKIFSSAGDEGMIQMWRENRFKPVALATTDILTSLQTGLVEVVPTTPLAALSLQWFRQTPYMQDLGLAPLVGGTVMSKRIWKRLDAEARQAVKKAAMETERHLRSEIPKQDDKAVEQMKQRGLSVVPVDEAGEKAWREAAEIFAKFRREQMKDKAFLDQVRQVRDAYRSANGD